MRLNRRIRWVAFPVAVFLVSALVACTHQQLTGYLPGVLENANPATNQTERVTGLWVNSWIVLLAVGVVTWGLMVWAMVAYRRRKGQVGLPVQLRYNMPIEFMYTIIPLILVLGFFFFTARDQTVIETRFASNELDVKVQVVAKQWAWDFNYLNENVYSAGVQGKFATDGPRGSLVESELPTLVLPVGAKVELELISRDVIHSFWVVDFLYKKDMFPGRTNYWSFVPEREGTFAGKCAELCGEYHSLMLFNVKVVSTEEYKTYIASLRKKGNTGQLDSKYNRNQNLPGTGKPEVE